MDVSWGSSFHLFDGFAAIFVDVEGEFYENFIFLVSIVVCVHGVKVGIDTLQKFAFEEELGQSLLHRVAGR